jgi:hypothetical protein
MILTLAIYTGLPESANVRSNCRRGTIKKNALIGLFGWSPYLLILLPVVAAFAFVHKFGVNVVFRDQWEMVIYFRNLSSGTLSLSDLWSQHNQHRSFFPRVAMLALGTLTKWNNVAEMYLILTCMLGALIAMFLAFKKSVGSKPLLFVPVAFLVFSLNQHWNMLFGYQLNFVFAATFGVLTLYLLHVLGERNLKRLAFGLAFAAAVLSGTVAAFSAIQGLFVWPAGLLQLLITPMEKRAKKFLVPGWGLIGLGEWTAYFIDHDTNTGSSPTLHFSEHLLATVVHFPALLGSSLFFPQQKSLAFASGLLLMGLILVGLILAYKRRERACSFWIALLSFSVLTLVSVTVGRAGLGVENALTSRYTTFSLLAVVGIYVILVKLALGERPRRLAVASVGILSTVILFSLPISYYLGVHAGMASRDLREEAAFVLSTYDTQPDERLKILRNQSPQTLRTRAQMLENLGYNVFSKPDIGSSQNHYPQSFSEIVTPIWPYSTSAEAVSLLHGDEG